MPRFSRALLLCGALVGSGLLLAACREHTVTLGLDVEAGDEQSYRYDIALDITHALDGEDPETVSVVTTVTADQEIIEVDGTGATAEVTLRTDGGPPRTTEVRLDPSGLLSGVTLIAEEDLAGFDLEALAQMLPPVPLPTDAVTVGSHWPVDTATTTGAVRFDRLGVVDGRSVAMLTSKLAEKVEEVRPAADTTATVLGTVRSRTTVAFDLGDGTARRLHSESTGDLTTAIMPPTGIDAAPVTGSIRYVVRVEATRID